MVDFINKVDEVQRCFREQGLEYKIADICKIAASMPAPRFYIDDTKTVIKQYNLFKQGKSNIRNIEKRKMYAEIFARYDRLVDAMLRTGQTVCKRDVFERILSQPAPSFYYDGNSALKMYYYCMANKRRLRK